MRFDSQIAKSRATKVLEDLRGMEAKIRATRDEMDAIEVKQPMR